MGQQESQFSDEEEGEYNYNRGVMQTVFDLRVTGSWYWINL